MNKQRGDVELIIAAILAAILTVGAFSIDAMSCHSKWDDAGMAEVSYGLLKNCMVKLPDGRWLPADRVREIGLPKKVKE